MYWILFIGIALASWLVQANLKNKFEKYSKIPIDGGLTGRVADRSLQSGQQDGQFE